MLAAAVPRGPRPRRCQLPARPPDVLPLPPSSSIASGTRGPMTVAEFVDARALPRDAGLLRAGAASGPGAAGDFFTSVDLGPLFGELLACQFAEMWQILARAARGRHGRGAARFDLVEAGGRQRPARARHPRRAPSGTTRSSTRAVRLHLVERSPRRGPRSAACSAATRRALASSTAELPDAVDGVIYANELLDALPPHLVVMRDEGLREVYVDAERGRLGHPGGAAVFVRGSPSTSTAVGARLEPGWFAEVNLAAADWIRPRGRPRSPAGSWSSSTTATTPPRSTRRRTPTGTLTTYRRHASERREDGPGWLLEPGERDITSHVDLTGVRPGRPTTPACDCSAWSIRRTSCSASASPSDWPSDDGDSARRPRAAPGAEDAAAAGRPGQHPQGDGLREIGRRRRRSRGLSFGGRVT